MKNIHKIGKELYIISDEEIKEGDWVYCTERKLFGKVVEIQLAKQILDTSMLYFEINDEEIWCKLFNCKKIILTTDQDLIDVQAIDDEFLEWFVKNPSCEEVEVERDSREVGGDNGGVQIEYGYYEIIIPKEETLEEVAEKYQMENGNAYSMGLDDAFYDGAYWNQERSYSEQDMIDFAYKYIDERRDQGARAMTPELLIKQFKKK